MSSPLCRLEDIPDGGARGFVLDQATADALSGGERDIFIARRGDAVYGYVNSCPHAGSPLDWVEDQFMTHDRERLLCATHGAEFRVDDGVCVAGPCIDARLYPVPVILQNGQVFPGKGQSQHRNLVK